MATDQWLLCWSLQLLQTGTSGTISLSSATVNPIIATLFTRTIKPYHHRVYATLVICMFFYKHTIYIEHYLLFRHFPSSSVYKCEWYITCSGDSVCCTLTQRCGENSQLGLTDRAIINVWDYIYQWNPAEYVLQ
jgi:hypothetical protein